MECAVVRELVPGDCAGVRVASLLLPLQGIRSQDQRLQLSQSFKHRLDTMQAAQSRGIASNATLNSMPSMA